MFAFKTFLFESMLLEDKVDFILKTLADWSEKNLQWLVNMYIKGQFSLEDKARILNVITDFNKEKKGLEKKDLNQYKTIDEIETTVKQHTEENQKRSHRQGPRPSQEVREADEQDEAASSVGNRSHQASEKRLLMKLNEILNEGLLDKIKQKLGEFKGKVMSSVESLLQHFKKHPDERLTTIETFKVKEISKSYESRVDTGAAICAFHAEDIEIDKDKGEVSFKHAGTTYKLKMTRIRNTKSASGVTDRPVVKLSYVWNKKTYSGIDTSLIDRSKLKFKILVGRNLIAELKLPVYVADNDEKE